MAVRTNADHPQGELLSSAQFPLLSPMASPPHLIRSACAAAYDTTIGWNRLPTTRHNFASPVTWACVKGTFGITAVAGVKEGGQVWRQRTCEEAFARGRALKQASFFIYLTNLKE